MKKFVLSLFGVLFLSGVSFGADIFKPFGNNYEVSIATNYAVAIIATQISTVPAMSPTAAKRWIVNPTTTTLYYTFNSVTDITSRGLTLKTSDYMDTGNYFGALYFIAPAGSSGSEIRVGEITTKY